MKKATISVKINVADDFEMGDCRKCPFVISEYKEYSYCIGEYSYKCPLKCNATTCPMEIEEQRDIALHEKLTKTAKSEAVKEFAKWLKGRYKDFVVAESDMEMVVNDLLKEYLGG